MLLIVGSNGPNWKDNIITFPDSFEDRSMQLVPMIVHLAYVSTTSGTDSYQTITRNIQDVVFWRTAKQGTRHSFEGR